MCMVSLEEVKKKNSEVPWKEITGELSDKDYFLQLYAWFDF